MKKNKKKNKLFAYRQVANLIIVLILATFCFYINNSNSEYVFNYNNDEAIYNGNRNSNKVSLMINVYWGNEYLDDMLNTLDEYNVKCTFFIGGTWAEKYPELLTEIYEHGHEIGNHGYFHKDQDKYNYDQNFEEINACNKMIKSIIGYDVNLFAPPSGAFNKSTLKASSDLGCLTIMWSKDTIDWRDKDSNLIFKRATNNVIGGDLILMHPTEFTAKALPLILSYYKINNIQATTVTDTLS